jgi:hypothetical protein
MMYYMAFVIAAMFAYIEAVVFGVGGIMGIENTDNPLMRVIREVLVLVLLLAMGYSLMYGFIWLGRRCKWFGLGYSENRDDDIRRFPRTVIESLYALIVGISSLFPLFYAIAAAAMIGMLSDSGLMDGFLILFIIIGAISTCLIAFAAAAKDTGFFGAFPLKEEYDDDMMILVEGELV